MEAVKFIYNNAEVDFLPSGNDNLMVNATQMAKIFGKQVNEFTSNENTKRFINECLKPANAGFNNGNFRFLGIENESDLIDSKQKSGTWMHRILALKFTAWLDPAFELWVFVTIDKIILGHYKELKEATIEKLIAEKELKEKKEELLKKYPELIHYFNQRDKLTISEKNRLKSIRETVKQLRLELFAELLN